MVNPPGSAFLTLLLPASAMELASASRRPLTALRTGCEKGSRKMAVRAQRIRANKCSSPRTIRLQLEWLESRCLLSSSPLLPSNIPIVEQEPNDTLDQAQILGTLTNRIDVLG